MGYYTAYELSIIEGDPKGIVENLIEQNEDAGDAIDENGNYIEECKWYDHDIDMKDFSKQYPHHLFCLKGKGEEQADLWKTYYKNGKSQECRAIITYPEYDESKLE